METIEQAIDMYRQTEDPKYLTKIERAKIDNNTSTSEGFPSLYDRDFKKRLYSKREFLPYMNSINTSTFTLEQHQVFVAKLMNPITPYNGLLLFHNVGTGKTCTALTIAEQFTNKRAHIIHPKTLRETWMNEIYNPDKHDTEQCLGGLYRDTTQNRINKYALKRKYQFHTPDKLGNEYQRHVDDETLNSWLFSQFENTIIIVDEVHHAREIKQNEKKAFELLGIIADRVPGVKMLFLSATPMYDDANEIEQIKNILTRLDKIQENVSLEWFASRYVSYMRAYNVENFPVRLTPSQVGIKPVLTEKNAPSKTPTGEKITEGSHLRFIECIPTPPSNRQKELLQLAMDNTKYRGFVDQIPNIVFPNDSIGSDGLLTVVSRTNDNPVQFKYINNIFRPTEFPKYAPKLASIVDAIQRSTGVVFVYTEYKDSGVYPLAMALEEAGFNRMVGPNKWSNIASKRTKNGQGYMILHGDESDAIGPMLHAIQDDKNIHGEIVKIVLATQVAGEGISLKHVREIHIVEPWYNMNRLEQVIGRAIRNKSHEYLPLERRNVVVCHHVLQDPKDTCESIEIQRYRNAIMKQISISKTERLLKENAIDCGLNYAKLIRENTQRRHIITSRETHIKSFSLDDNDYSKECDYMKCGLKCSIMPPERKNDLSTYYPAQMIHEIETMKRTIQERIREGAIVLPFPEDTIEKLAFVDMVEQKERFEGPNGTCGYLIVIGNGYVFQPEIIEDPKLLMEHRHRIIDNVQPPKHSSMALHKTFSLSMRSSVKTKEEREKSLDAAYKTLIENWNKIVNEICNVSYVQRDNIDTMAVNCIAIEQTPEIHKLLYYGRNMPSWILETLKRTKRGMVSESGTIIIANVYTSKGDNTIQFNILTLNDGKIEQCDSKMEQEYWSFLTKDIDKKRPDNSLAVLNPLSKEEDRFKLTISTVRTSAFRSIGRVCRTWNIQDIFNSMQKLFGNELGIRTRKEIKKNNVCTYFHYLLLKNKPEYFLHGAELMAHAYQEENGYPGSG